MSRRLTLLAVLWILSLVAAAYAASQERPVLPKNLEPWILTGENLGFRLAAPQGSAVTGTLVVRIDGKWVEARSAVKVVPVK
jgi:hypothetical protein